MKNRIKVLVVDDSAMVRKIFTQELAKDPSLEVVGSAPEPFVARDKIVRLKPDVLILDIEMPKMDGLTFLEKLMIHHPMPVIIVSSLAIERSEVIFKAFELGAAEVMAKPGPAYTVQDMSEQLIEKIKGVARAKKYKHPDPRKPAARAVKPQGEARTESTPRVIAVGASTGGTVAITEVLTRLPLEMPPILVVQHMPPHFTKAFADRLNNLCALEIREAEDREPLSRGKVLIAPGDRHMVLRRCGANYHVELDDGPAVYHQRPSVEVLFQSVAANAGANAIGVLLTGMGKDGAQGLLAMKEAGAFTIAQDEASCVVYGMPGEAVEIGAAERVVALGEIPRVLVGHS